jgi:SOS-response transcriptional repressor LexA
MSDEHANVPDLIGAELGDTVLRMRGTHLEPEVQAGDWLIVRDATEAADGQLAVLEVDGAMTVRRLPFEGVVKGVVVGLMRRLEEN